ncbi:MAG: metallophosphoesterase [Planctomycetaceae bacterium]|nr:metallophosphoesterase [Planctomycetaceae bacterium]
MDLADAPLLFLGLLGHAAIWIGLVNRLHGLAFPRVVVRWLTLLRLIALATLPLAYLANLYIQDLPWLRPTQWTRLAAGLQAYGWGAAAMGLFVSARWGWRQLPRAGRELCRVQSSTSLSPAAELARHPVANPIRRAISRLPGNQSLELEVVEKELVVPRLPPALDGLSIAHLTDLHYTGGISREYFEVVARITNDLNPDLIAVTGDLVDKVHCIDWLPATLGRLRAPQGVYAILGNHDLRVKGELGRLRRVLTDLGIVDLGLTHRHIEISGARVLLAGNERPWIVPPADAPECPDRDEDEACLRLLLSHSPDQLGWARQRGFDLMLAGHTHGGQIRLPGVGALLCPSLYGVKYDCGVFHEPPTVLHVSRGLSGVDPLRFFCPPELVRLVLRAPAARSRPTAQTTTEAEPAGVR